MQCYLCQSSEFANRKGVVRDAPGLGVVQCVQCGLVTLSSQDHIHQGFYESSGMHGAEPVSMDAWLKDTAWDDQRRFEMLKPLLANKKVLDFGCGAGGFLERAQVLAAEVTGIELETRVCAHWQGKLNVIADVSLADDSYDLITAFHVIEHLPDPRSMLSRLSSLLSSNGRMVVEVPSSEDALLTLYDCDAFQRFTYWSQHLYLFNASTLETLVRQAGLRVIALQHYQRYSLANHLHWLSQSKPGGHMQWEFLDTPEVKQAYASSLSAIGKTDTLIVHLQKMMP